MDVFFSSSLLHFLIGSLKRASPIHKRAIEISLNSVEGRSTRTHANSRGGSNISTETLRRSALQTTKKTKKSRAGRHCIRHFCSLLKSEKNNDLFGWVRIGFCTILRVYVQYILLYSNVFVCPYLLFHFGRCAFFLLTETRSSCVSMPHRHAVIRNSMPIGVGEKGIEKPHHDLFIFRFGKKEMVAVLLPSLVCLPNG